MATDKKSIWQKIFPSFFSEDASRSIVLPTVGVYEDFVGDATKSGSVCTTTSEDGKQFYELPLGRLARYPIFDTMATDPTIDSAMKMHIAHALSARSDSGEIIKIESVNDGDNAIVNELRTALGQLINQNCHAWAYNSAKYGCWYARVYVKDKTGVEAVRSDFYTHPRFVNEYQQAGQLAGFSSSYQQPGKTGQAMMEPWKFVGFKIPIWSTPGVEPQRLNAVPIDLNSDDYADDGVTESQNYGQSLLETAFVPWMDLQNAILAMNMSRSNAARLERMIGVNTGKLNPAKAAQYLNIVSGQLQKTDKANAERSLKKGFVQTVINHIIPIFGDGRGRLDISTVEGSPNIDGLADIDFHIKRLGSALGIDPALLGFGEMLAGGLGDGGFFRVSVLAAIKADLLRQAILNGVERLCEIHLASKLGKVFLPSDKPWRVVFNSVSTAMEREERENMEGRAGFATALVQMVQLMDQEFATCDKQALSNYLWTDILKVPEEKFSLMFPSDKAKKEEADAAAMNDAVLAQQQAMAGVDTSEADAAITESAIKSYIDTLYQEPKEA